MMANHGFTGSGSLNDDDAITSSPASSSAGRASGGIAHLSSPQTHGNSQMRKFQQSPLQGFGKSDLDKLHGGISPQRIGVFPSTVQMPYDGRGKREFVIKLSSLHIPKHGYLTRRKRSE